MISTCRHSARHSTRGFDLSSHRSGTVVTPHGAAAARSVRHCRRSARRLLLALALSACACCDVVTAYGTAAAVGTRSVRHFRRSARRLRSWRLRSRRTRGCDNHCRRRFIALALSSLRTALPLLGSALALLALALSAYACCDSHCRRRFIALVGTVVTPHGTLRVVATTTAVAPLDAAATPFDTYLLQSALTYCSRSTRRLSLWSALSSLCTALPPLLVLPCARSVRHCRHSARRSRLLALSALACALGIRTRVATAVRRTLVVTTTAIAQLGACTRVCDVVATTTAVAALSALT